MTRSEMIGKIAEEAKCSKRLVRKKLFQLSAKMKMDKYKNLLFNQAFLTKTLTGIIARTCVLFGMLDYMKMVL